MRTTQLQGWDEQHGLGFQTRCHPAPDLMNFQLAIFPAVGKISLARSLGLLNTQPPGRVGLKAEEMTATAKNSGRQWSPEEDERLRELAVSSATPAEIAEKLNRTESATKARAYVLRVGLRRFRAKRRDLSKWD
jgi:hypothetical protein